MCTFLAGRLPPVSKNKGDDADISILPLAAKDPLTLNCNALVYISTFKDFKCVKVLVRTKSASSPQLKHL